MPNINIPIDAALLKAFGAKVHDEDTTQREIILGLIRKYVGWDEPKPQTKGAAESSKAAVASPKARESSIPGVVTGAGEKRRESVVQKAAPVIPSVQQMIAESQKRLSHDTKACRVYKCGLCQSLGVKDKNRGLE